jgi:hypothetical protein
MRRLGTLSLGAGLAVSVRPFNQPHIASRRNSMQSVRHSLSLLALAAALSSGLAATSAFAGSACEAQAAEKKLAGAAKTSFLKKCEADAAAATAAGGDACEAKAAEKKLAGAAKNSFVKKCQADEKAAAAGAACDAKAAEKKLAGAAKNSFVKKCVADAAKG